MKNRGHLRKTSTGLLLFILVAIVTISCVLMWYEPMQTRNPPFRVDDVSYLDDVSTLEGLHVKIRKQIQSIQEDGNCEEKKILHCQNGDNFAGFGSMVMRYGVCMQVAFALGRIFFIHQREYEHFGGIFRFLSNESSKCGYLKRSFSSATGICNMHNKSCYLDNGYEIDNSHKILQYDAINVFPAPRRVPGTLPRQIETKLKALGVKTPWLWFTSQFLGYLFRLKPGLVNLINTFKNDIRHAFPLVSMHIRRGDKLAAEAKYVQEEAYMSAVDSYYQTFLPNERKRVYVASDDINIISKLKGLRPGYEFLQLPRAYLDKFLVPRSYYKANFPKEVIESIIIELYFLTSSNYTICTFSSNVCRLVWSLKASTPPYTVENRIYSVERNKELSYYLWWGYQAPFRNLWVSTGNSSLSSTLSDGSKLMPYVTGKILQTRGDATFKTVNNEVLSVVYVNTIWWDGGGMLGYDSPEGYVFTKDLVAWPGMPSYHFYDNVSLR